MINCTCKKVVHDPQEGCKEKSSANPTTLSCCHLQACLCAHVCSATGDGGANGEDVNMTELVSFHMGSRVASSLCQPLKLTLPTAALPPSPQASVCVLENRKRGNESKGKA